MGGKQQAIQYLPSVVKNDSSTVWIKIWEVFGICFPLYLVGLGKVDAPLIEIELAKQHG